MSEQLVILASAASVAVGMLASVSASAQAADPIRVTNLNPLVAVSGLPLWSGVSDETAVGLTTELANHYRLSERAGHQIIIDGETLRMRVFIERPLGDGWSFGADLPFFYQSGGVLDDVVDSWHSAFNMPDGDRNRRPEGVLEYSLSNVEGQFFNLTRSSSGLGDMQLSLARELGEGGWIVRAAIKLPTGREQILAGSGGTDISINVLRREDAIVRGRAAGFYYGFGLTDIEQPDQILYPVEDQVLTGIVGGGVAIGQRFGFKGQIDAHSALYDSQLEEIGQTSVMASIGGWLDIGDSTLFEFAVSEDLHVSTTPDVALVFNLSWTGL